MRLWHKDLIHYLPRQQLIAQWRECCAIAGSIAKKGTLNHLLVNKILKYPSTEFSIYTSLVIDEMNRRNYEISKKALDNFDKNMNYCLCFDKRISGGTLFEDWHNDRYLKQCLFNLQEKYDCGGISEEEWKRIEEHFDEYLD